MDKLEPAGPEEILYEGKFFEIVKQPMKTGEHRVDFEIARRAPGTRLIIVNNGKILLNKEYRSELGCFDYRLPGGKVFNTLGDYRAALAKDEDLLPYAVEAAKKECLEETGLCVKSIKHFQTAKAGATIVWDLFYFVVDDFEESPEGLKLEPGEVIRPEWKTFDEVKELCLEGEVREDRSVGILFRFLSNTKTDQHVLQQCKEESSKAKEYQRRDEEASEAYEQK